MKSILNDIEQIYEINKSKFICNLIYIENIDEAKEIINNICKKYNDATHNCYAYIIDGYEKCSDDGEPSGTAGMPILNVLKSNKLNHVLCIVTRYFGGIKLGAGGLVRAYTKSVTNCLNDENLCELKNGKQYKILFTYENSKTIDNILKDIKINNKEYDELISYTIIIDDEQIIINLKQICEKIEFIKNTYIKKVS